MASLFCCMASFLEVAWWPNRAAAASGITSLFLAIEQKKDSQKGKTGTSSQPVSWNSIPRNPTQHSHFRANWPECIHMTSLSCKRECKLIQLNIISLLLRGRGKWMLEQTVSSSHHQWKATEATWRFIKDNCSSWWKIAYARERVESRVSSEEPPGAVQKRKSGPGLSEWQWWQEWVDLLGCASELKSTGLDNKEGVREGEESV